MSRIEREKKTVQQMIELYCKHHHHSKDGMLCEECRAVTDYAHKRLGHCKFGEQKTTCQKCPIHCYKPEMRQQISTIMRYSGPRMIIYHPIAAIRHLLDW
ncbi:MAG: nitrous oxide-stimulated promoter family protein [Bacteroidaceae bacterium]|nr:nitrous oxide-stimulated promoter family protein [Bacteroidaceae bacterium]